MSNSTNSTKTTKATKATKAVKYSDEAIAIANVFKAHPNTEMSWRKACSLANVPSKSGYLRAVMAILGADTLHTHKNDLIVQTTEKVSGYTYNEADTGTSVLDGEIKAPVDAEQF